MPPSSARRTSFQNLSLSGKDKLIGATLTNGNNTPATSHDPNPTVALLVVSALTFVAQYLEDNLQQIFKIVIDSRSFVLPPALVPALQQYKSSCERPLKARFANVYWGKTHLEYYNFFQQCEDNFAISRAKDQNWVSFATIFFKDIALFCCQQYQPKVEDKTNVPITWKNSRLSFAKPWMNPKDLSTLSRTLFGKTLSIS